jgi:hypothetical protein
MIDGGRGIGKFFRGFLFSMLAGGIKCSGPCRRNIIRESKYS